MNKREKAVKTSAGQYIKNLLGGADHFKMPLGEVLTRRGIITSEQLEKALNLQEDTRRKHGKAAGLGQIIVELKYTNGLPSSLPVDNLNLTVSIVT